MPRSHPQGMRAWEVRKPVGALEKGETRAAEALTGTTETVFDGVVDDQMVLCEST